MINSGTQLDKYNVPYAIYMDYVGQNEMAQLDNVLKADGVVQMAVMPDCHAGYVSPVGCVLRTEGIVYPAVVGYDIGCGMRTDALEGVTMEEIRDNAVAIRDLLKGTLNIGVGRARKLLHNNLEYDKAFGEYSKDVGSLGGGNHFLEIGYEEKSKAVFVTIHTGSRGYGHKIGTEYMKLAAELNGNHQVEAMNGLDVVKNKALVDAYLRDYSSAIRFAFANRRVLMAATVEILRQFFKKAIIATPVGECLHNMVEVSGNIDKFLHRKGATVAAKGNTVIIPGNMRDGIIVGKGLGSTEGINSCSHGAGRILSRSQAKSQISMEHFAETMKNVPGAMVSQATLDEAPDAYKNIDDVMKSQVELVEELFRIKPLVNIKG